MKKYRPRPTNFIWYTNSRDYRNPNELNNMVVSFKAYNDPKLAEMEKKHTKEWFDSLVIGPPSKACFASVEEAENTGMVGLYGPAKRSPLSSLSYFLDKKNESQGSI